MSEFRQGVSVAAMACLLWLGMGLGIGGVSHGQSGFRGRLVVDGETVLATENPDHRMTPASVLKLVVACTALHHLGPQHRITTRLASDAPLDENTLRGDLWIQAAGDPTWNGTFFPDNPRQPLDRLAQQLSEQGIRRIDGDLVLSTAHFAGRDLPPSRALDELPYAWAAATSALAVDDNSLRLEIAPGPQVGAPGKARLLHPPSPTSAAVATPLLINEIRTVEATRHGKGTVDLLPDWQQPQLLLRGEYPISEPPYVIAASRPQPSLYAAQELRRALRRRGIRLSGTLRQTTVGLPPKARALAEVESPTLAERLPVILRHSHNWQAEMLLRSLAFEVEGNGRHDTGLDLEARFLAQTVGIDEASFVLVDASGLSPYNLITPRAVVELLRFAWQQPWRRVLLDALAQPGKGTLAAWGALPPMAAKSGTVRHSLGLAGYLGHLAGPQSGSMPVVFVDMISHDPSPRPELRALIRRDLRAATSTKE